MVSKFSNNAGVYFSIKNVKLIVLRVGICQQVALNEFISDLETNDACVLYSIRKIL
jgi:hypothetical protein